MTYEFQYTVIKSSNPDGFVVNLLSIIRNSRAEPKKLGENSVKSDFIDY